MTNRLIIGMLLVGYLIMGCKKDAALPPVAPPAARIATQVVVGTPVRTTLRDSFLMNAVTVFTNRESIRATVTGYVDKTRVGVGTSVGAGQEVFVLQTREAAVLGEEILSDSSINITGMVPVVSRNTGIVTQLFYLDGDFVVEGDILAELTRPSALAIKLYVPFERGDLVRTGKRVQIRLPDGRLLAGTVGQLLPSEDIGSQTTPYLVALNTATYLPENLNLMVFVPGRVSRDALTVPASAIQTNEVQTSFWVMQLVNDSLAVRHDVHPGMRGDSLVELRGSSLNVGDRIVLQGAYGLEDSSLVSVVSKL
ncbi:efflux RND transporter periplasmic adaptor subunit [Lewinella sp. JB7]|uniref:efflux RND transporter periplasmic adaptor subunit n=1 Tax=Lewinella sp. JB7 TaxID=2962887 RepID=UPI0020C9D8D9|nr:HlyD family efflux transporter periplasmic adaptor subunit [Lewinella sp. JB7]MCP9234734.1 HlyD family efflux transporter periplasmic adaptor subunit [Lewinella sp. JB7]